MDSEPLPISSDFEIRAATKSGIIQIQHRNGNCFGWPIEHGITMFLVDAFWI